MVNYSSVHLFTPSEIHFFYTYFNIKHDVLSFIKKNKKSGGNQHSKQLKESLRESRNFRLI